MRKVVITNAFLLVVVAAFFLLRPYFQSAPPVLVPISAPDYKNTSDAPDAL